MEELIKQAFMHVDLLGPHVADGHYDVIGPNGEIILPQVWETMIEPDWSIDAHVAHARKTTPWCSTWSSSYGPTWEPSCPPTFRSCRTTTGGTSSVCSPRPS